MDDEMKDMAKSFLKDFIDPNRIAKFNMDKALKDLEKMDE